MSCLLRQDTNVRLHLRGMERCDAQSSQEGASASGMCEMQDCNSLGGNLLHASDATCLGKTPFRIDGGVPLTYDGCKSTLIFPTFSRGFTRYGDTTQKCKE